MDDLCPCGSEQVYQRCCGLLIEGTARPETAEQLMRSRYSAYVLQREPYLLDTWHPLTRPTALQLHESSPVKWIGLEIKRKERGGNADTDGIVEFVARYKLHGKAQRLHETSRFVKENGRWYYQDATG